jgi:hypothetical protein
MIKFFRRCEEPHGGDEGVLEGQAASSFAGGIPVVVVRNDTSF